MQIFSDNFQNIYLRLIEALHAKSREVEIVIIKAIFTLHFVKIKAVF